jgi:polyhydroxyalkanoate synthesis regulator phasin
MGVGKGVDKVSKNVIGQLGALNSYLEDMEEVSNKLKKVGSYDEEQTKGLISKLFKLYRFVGRTERYEKREEDRLDKDLHKSLNDLESDKKKEVENLIDRFHAMTNTLVKELSLFSGGVKEELKNLKSEKDLIDHLKERDWTKFESEQKKLADEASKLSDHLEKLGSFCKGAIVTVKKIMEKL